MRSVPVWGRVLHTSYAARIFRRVVLHFRTVQEPGKPHPPNGEEPHTVYHFKCTCSVLQIAAACDFYTYIGHISKGFIKLEGRSTKWLPVRFYKSAHVSQWFLAGVGMCFHLFCHLDSVTMVIYFSLAAEELYWQVSRLRAMMNLARLNLELPDQ